MRICVRCPNELHKSGNESGQQFNARKYCSRACVDEARRERSRLRKTGTLARIQEKARVMGGNKMVHNAILNAFKVRQIRELHKPLGFSVREIAEHMLLPTDVVSKVLRGITWRHVV